MVIVKFSNSQEQSLQTTAETRVVDALNTLGLSFGLTDTSEFVKEWGLTEPHTDQRWVNKSWLRNDELLARSSSTVFLLGKKIFTKTDEIHLLTIPPFLREILYHQMLQMYLFGAYFSSAYKAIKLSALAAHFHVSTDEYLTSGTKWLQSYLPPRLNHYPYLPALIDKNMKGIGQRNKAVVQTAFIKGIMRLETFGLSLYNVNIDHQVAVLGIGFKGLFWLDPDNFEPIKHWQPETIKQVTLSNDTLNIAFNTNEAEIELESACISDVSHCLASTLSVLINRPSSYALEAGGDDDSSHTGIEIVNVQQVPSVEMRRERGRGRGGREGDNEPGGGGIGHDARRRNSPFGRHGNRRRAFRKKKNLLTKEDSVEDLSEIMGVDFNSINPSWSVKGNAVSPIYDMVASTRVDTLLRLSKLTSTTLSTTLKHSKRTSVLQRVPLPYEEVHFPPLLPPKPPNFRTSIVVEVKTNGVPTAPVEEAGPQRLGMYLIDAPPTPSNGVQHSRLVQPYEALRDYATLRREFRMFCVKLPNGMIHWELASLYQPIHKLISRLCILIHAESHMDEYSLFVEGGILSQLKENTPIGPEFTNDSEQEFELSRVAPPRDGLNSMGKVFVPSKKHQVLPVMDNPVILDPKLAFKDHGITTSRLLSLKSTGSERLPRMAIKVPDWVKFHQCWLGIVHGNQPCQLQDAITLAAVLYQCYVLDKTDANSVIGSCNIVDFLPVGFSCIKGIEQKVLKERENFLSYSRQELEQIYIKGATTSPLHQTVFFPCKEPKRQFLKSAKLVPIIIGINHQGIVRVDPKSCEIMNIWSYEVFKNWGFSKKSFLLEFESSMYPLKCNQSKWMSKLVDFYIKSIDDLKHTEVEEETEERGGGEEEETANAQTSDVARPYFVLEEDAPALASASNPYFVLEKVYEELLQVRDTTMQRNQEPGVGGAEGRDTRRNEGAVGGGGDACNKATKGKGMESLYVNPHPNCSLIHPNEATTLHLQKLGLVPLRDHEEEEEEEEEEEDQKRYFTVMNYSESSSDWEENNNEDENPYDDILNVLSHYHSKRLSPVISEHIYYLPPDCYQPKHQL